ncbi:uncharacterized protein EKO05_0011108 [Ascochyta rabiei]|uniref:Apple domain-containing protein n=1 Tax=Didymella rabiei TaxID=5454 RepID=A0A162ZDC7_DIDRA|nr:uncharacterized protein EKO05_0011108 [Ascochyta rabiei]KZM20546.1 hypothetical protein ST47_g8320 [Ascochyta rabiei]UPX20895.1 hypothetical protein EKO05_0011108 [Ascochyta rabiei]
MVSLSTKSLLALLWASAALATSLFAEPISNRGLEVRDGAVCPDGYTSKNGMNFTTYCKTNNPSNDAYGPFASPSMADCMEHCSRYWGDSEGCYGIVWREDNKCWIRNSTTSVAGVKDSTDGTHSALVAPNTYAKISTTCPEADLSTHTLDGVPGLGYTVHCNKVIDSTFDTCWSGYPKPCWDAQHLDGHFIGFYHTETLEECVRICTDQSPLCKAVSWNPGYEIGFANCWPKSGFSDNDMSTPSTKNGILHTVTITSFDSVDADCPSSQDYTARGNTNFKIHCGQLNEGTNITSIHTQNITSCMDSCATTDKCVGVVFDSTLQNGFSNCYLQNTTSTISNKASATFAALSGSSVPSSSSSSTPGNPNPSPSDDSGSKAWIAGPVVGGLAGLAIIGGAIFLWRRRKNAQNIHSEGNSGGPYDAAPAYSPVVTPHGAPQHTGYYDAHPMSEADGTAVRTELPETTKYAHRTGEGEVHEAP